MSETFKVLHPATRDVVCERPWATPAQVDAALGAAAEAFDSWRAVDVLERQTICRRFVEAVVSRTDELAAEITAQMGRPIRHAGGEIRGFAERAQFMIAEAPAALEKIPTPPKLGFTRRIDRVPLGCVLVLSPWNYPWLTAVNAVVPALMAGNTVVLKHSEQTPLVAERFAEAFAEAGLPAGVFQFVHADHALVGRMVADRRVAHVCFTGSVGGGHAVVKAAAGRFVGFNLELGGKDAAIVRADADLARTAANLVDGVCYNAGQSCCGVERIYAHRDIFDELVERMRAEMAGYRLGDPGDEETTLGPLVRTRNADHVRHQAAAALAAGARGLVDEAPFVARGAGQGGWVAPQLYVDVDHSMALMREETFGPVVGVMPFEVDDEAVALANDSRFGLTASVWTADVQAAERMGAALEVGTVFMNRCDALDPALAWTGVGDSGHGATLSRVGYEQLTRPKSFHLRHTPG